MYAYMYMYHVPLMVSHSSGEGGILTLAIMQSIEKKGISNGHVCHMALEVKA